MLWVALEENVNANESYTQYMLNINNMAEKWVKRQLKPFLNVEIRARDYGISGKKGPHGRGYFISDVVENSDAELHGVPVGGKVCPRS